MKKSLIALAVLAASGAAMAKQKGEDAAMISGGVATSRWGLKGTEDLGGGLAVNFNFEQGVDLTDGTASGFDRQAWVGLSGGFGEIKLGKTGTAYDDVAVNANPLFDSVLSPAYAAASVALYDWNPSSGLYYGTPSFGGVSGALSTTVKDSANADYRVNAFHVKYENDKLFAALAYQQEKDNAGLNVKYLRLVGTYDFGAVKLLAAAGRVKDVEDDYTIGVDVPLGSNVVLSTGLTHVRPEVGDNGNSFGVAVAYNLSKRSALYTGFRVDDKKLTGTGERDHVFAVGLKHEF
jgi:predicted porin